MSPLVALTVIVGLLTLATVSGLLLKRRTGRVRSVTSGCAVKPEDFGLTHFGSGGSVVQFSTEYCARCPGVRRQIGELLQNRSTVTFAHVDVTHQPELAKKYDLMQTPTVLIIEAGGRQRTRLSGPLTRSTLETALTQLEEGNLS